MAFAKVNHDHLLLIALVALTALLVWFGNGLVPWWPLMWFAPLPSLWYAPRKSWKKGACVAFFGWLLGSLNMLAYFHAQGTPFLAWLADYGGLALLFTAGVLMFRRLIRGGAMWFAVAALPALWVSADWLRYWATPHGTSADLAYTQLRFLPFLQVASLTGPWGMTFVLICLPAAVAAFLYMRPRNAPGAWRLLALSAAGFFVLLTFGAVRLLRFSETPTIAVGLIASDMPENKEVADPGSDARRLLAAYSEQARALAANGATTIVMPEKVAVVRDQDRGLTDSSLQEIADTTHATIVAGELHASPSGDHVYRYNRAQVYEPNRSSLSYDKQHMLPHFESNLTRGNRLLTLQGANVREGIAICKDMDFTSLGRAYGQLGTGLVLVPAWDFNIDRVWHGHMAIMRGVESGFSVVRASKESSLFVSDAYGRVLAERLSGSEPFATLVVKVPVNHHWTLFQAWGNWFAWLGVGLCALTCVRVVSIRGPIAHALDDLTSNISSSTHSTNARNFDLSSTDRDRHVGRIA